MQEHPEQTRDGADILNASQEKSSRRVMTEKGQTLPSDARSANDRFGAVSGISVGKVMSLRRPMDMIVHGRSTSRFQAEQQ